MSVPITPAHLSTFLIAETALELISNPGTPPKQPPVAGRALTPAEASQLGLGGPGMTLAYQTDGGRMVFCDIAPTQLRVWFTGGDFADAPLMLDQVLRTKFPGLLPLGHGDHPTNPALQVHRYAVPLAGTRLAQISVTHAPPEAQGDDQVFFAEVVAQERTQ